MNIKMHIDPLLSNYTNNKRIVEANRDTVGGCLRHLVQQFPKLNMFIKDDELLAYQDCYLRVFVNGEIAHLEELDKPVKDGDELTLMLMIGGG